MSKDIKEKNNSESKKLKKEEILTSEQKKERKYFVVKGVLFILSLGWLVLLTAALIEILN